MHLGKLVAIGALTFINLSAHAQDEFYSIEPADRTAQAGDITASGFFETDGFGTSVLSAQHFAPPTVAIIGFEITLTNGTQSSTLCGGTAPVGTLLRLGCVENDSLLQQTGLIANSSGLYCAVSGCDVEDAGNGIGASTDFLLSGSGITYQIAYGNPLWPSQVTQESAFPERAYAIAGAPTTHAPPGIEAPEIDPASAFGSLALLLGCIAMLMEKRSYRTDLGLKKNLYAPFAST